MNWWCSDVNWQNCVINILKLFDIFFLNVVRILTTSFCQNVSSSLGSDALNVDWRKKKKKSRIRRMRGPRRRIESLFFILFFYKMLRIHRWKILFILFCFEILASWSFFSKIFFQNFFFRFVMNFFDFDISFYAFQIFLECIWYQG